MKATSILHKRVADAYRGFAEYVVWILAKPFARQSILTNIGWRTS